MFGHWRGIGLRVAFFKWKDNANFNQTVEDVNETGPVVEDVYKYWQIYKNLKYFLKDEAYTPQEISKIAIWAYNRQRGLVSRSVSRLIH